jgi:small multidrug resistance pump
MIWYLRLAGVVVFEALAVLLMEKSNAFADLKSSLLALVTYWLTFYCLTMALKYVPTGIANAMRAWASTVLVAVIAYFYLGEALTPFQWICLWVVALGLVGLNLG